MNRTIRVALSGGVLTFALYIGVHEVTHGQELDPLYAVPSYTTADPIDPSRLGLATPDGRFAILPLDGCQWLAEGESVNVYPNYALAPSLGISQADVNTGPTCIVRVDGRMSATPCFEDDTGTCAVAEEQP